MKKHMNQMIKDNMICCTKSKKQSMLNEELHEKKWHFRNWKHLDYNLNS